MCRQPDIVGDKIHRIHTSIRTPGIRRQPDIVGDKNPGFSCNNHVCLFTRRQPDIVGDKLFEPAFYFSVFCRQPDIVGDKSIQSSNCSGLHL